MCSGRLEMTQIRVIHRNFEVDDQNGNAFRLTTISTREYKEKRDEVANKDRSLWASSPLLSHGAEQLVSASKILACCHARKRFPRRQGRMIGLPHPTTFSGIPSTPESIAPWALLTPEKSLEANIRRVGWPLHARCISLLCMFHL